MLFRVIDNLTGLDRWIRMSDVEEISQAVKSAPGAPGEDRAVPNPDVTCISLTRGREVFAAGDAQSIAHAFLAQARGAEAGPPPPEADYEPAAMLSAARSACQAILDECRAERDRIRDSLQAHEALAAKMAEMAGSVQETFAAINAVAANADEAERERLAAAKSGPTISDVVMGIEKP